MQDHEKPILGSQDDLTGASSSPGNDGAEVGKHAPQQCYKYKYGCLALALLR